MYPDPGIHTQLDSQLQGVLLEEVTPVYVAAVQIETLDPNSFAAEVTSYSCIKNTTGVYDDNDAPTLICTINPTPEVETYD